MADDTPPPSEDAPTSSPPPSRAEIQRTEPTPRPDDDSASDDEDLTEGSELEEGEEVEEPIVNIPLAMSFLLGGFGFLLVFGINALGGMYVLPALGWASAAFVAVTIAGFIIDVLLTRYRTVIIQPIEIIEEPDESDTAGSEDEPDEDSSPSTPPPATAPAAEPDATPPQTGPA